MGHSRNILFLSIWKSENIGKQMYSFLKFWKPYDYRFGKRRAPENDEDTRNKFYKIMDMRSISIKKHEMEIW